MVRILILLFLFAQQVKAETYKIYWTGDQTVQCQNLVESFLKEFKNTVNNETIEFNIGSSKDSNLNSFQINCDPNNKNLLNVLNNKKIYNLHYLGKSAGFDSLEWLEIQKYALRQNQEGRALLLESKDSEELTELEPNKPSIWTPILIGTAIGAVGGAVFSPDALNRPLNTLVFGLAGAATGGLYAYWKF